MGTFSFVGVLILHTVDPIILNLSSCHVLYRGSNGGILLYYIQEDGSAVKTLSLCTSPYMLIQLLNNEGGEENLTIASELSYQLSVLTVCVCETLEFSLPSLSIWLDTKFTVHLLGLCYNTRATAAAAVLSKQINILCPE